VASGTNCCGCCGCSSCCALDVFSSTNNNITGGSLSIASWKPLEPLGLAARFQGFSRALFTCPTVIRPEVFKIATIKALLKALIVLQNSMKKAR